MGAQVVPRLLLDVDGVLNPVCERPPDTWPDYGVREVDGWHVTCSAAMAARLSAIAGRTEAVWLTTWGDRAVPLGRGIGLAIDAVAPRGPESPLGWWKLDAAQAMWAGDARPFVWIDDDVPFDAAARRWTEPLAEAGQCLVVAPDTQVGLTPAHLDEVEEFLARHGALPAAPGRP